MIFLLFLAIFVLLKEALIFCRAFVKSELYKISLLREILLGISFSYIFTIIFTGFSF